MPLVFAYGANMDVAAMASRCPRSKRWDPASDAPSPDSDARRLAHVTRDPHSRVHGIYGTWRWPMSRLDRYEGVREGLYVKRLQAVVADAAAKRALVYFGANTGPGILRADYLEALIAAARQWRLPAEALASLATFSRR